MRCAEWARRAGVVVEREGGVGHLWLGEARVLGVRGVKLLREAFVRARREEASLVQQRDHARRRLELDQVKHILQCRRIRRGPRVQGETAEGQNQILPPGLGGQPLPAPPSGRWLRRSIGTGVSRDEQRQVFLGRSRGRCFSGGAGTGDSPSRLVVDELDV